MPIYKRKTNGKASGSYWGAYWNPKTRKRERVSLKTTDKSAAEIRLGELQREAARDEAGIVKAVDPYEEHKLRPLGEHLADWRGNLLARGTTLKHAELSHSFADKVIVACEFKHTTDLSASAVEAYLADRRKAGMSIATSNHYATAVKSFGTWLVKDKRIAENPLKNLAKQNAETDRRHERRALSHAELVALLDAARTGPERLGMTGPDRAMVYTLAVETGLRLNELRTLAWSCLDLDADDPTVTLLAANTKNRRADTLPLKHATAQTLARWRDARGEVAETDYVFPTLPKWHPAEMLRQDLDVARAAHIDAAENPKDQATRTKSSFCKAIDNDGRHADFHALRHTFISSLVRGGVHPKVAQKLARHSTITLTMDRYSHTLQGELATALDTLPDLSAGTDSTANQMLATGTHGKPADKNVSETCRPSIREGCNPSVIEGSDGDVSPSEMDCNSSENLPFSAENVIAPRRTRTFDPLIKSPIPADTKKERKPSGDKHLQQIANSTHKQNVSETCHSRPGGKTATADPELAKVVAAWAELPDAIRAGIIAMINAATPNRNAKK